MVQVLLQKDADVSLKSSDGSTAADIAFVNGKERVSTRVNFGFAYILVLALKEHGIM